MSILPPPVKVRTKDIPADVAEALRPRIMRDIEVDENDCWIRTAGIHPQTGYSTCALSINKKRYYFLAHRVMYTADRWPIPDGYTIDHLCEVRACVNPEHLAAVPHRDNVLRSKTNPAAINSRKTTCNSGHELRTLPSGKRYCPTCHNVPRRKKVAT